MQWPITTVTRIRLLFAERVIQLCTGPKVKINSDFTDKQIVQRSPFYLCRQLWDELDRSIQLSRNMLCEFIQNIKNVALS